MDELYRFFNDKEQMIAMVMCKDLYDVLTIAHVLVAIRKCDITIKNEDNTCYKIYT
jgi:hypothetical protein